MLKTIGQRAFLFICVIGWMISLKSWAYNSFSHEHITRNAVHYLKTHEPHHPEMNQWLNEGSEEKYLTEEILVRANVDSDYRSDLWFESWFHPATFGAFQDLLVYPYTATSHFLDISGPGRYWERDGFSYQRSSKQGRDALYDLPSVRVEGKISTAFGGTNDHHVSKTPFIGNYRFEFKGSEEDWNHLYFEDTYLSHVVFPPANVPAELAFQDMLSSPRADETFIDHWDESLTLASGLMSTKIVSRHYMRGEIQGLPSRLDSLGLTIHLAQDMTVSHHTLVSTDLCHSEYESFVDQLDALQEASEIDSSGYQSGVFFGLQRSWKSFLYDEELVKKLLNEHPALKLSSEQSIKQRMYKVAEESNQWKWSKDGPHYVLTLPSGETFSQKTCDLLINTIDVHQQIRIQYNLAVAFTVALLNLAAHDYETKK